MYTNRIKITSQYCETQLFQTVSEISLKKEIYHTQQWSVIQKKFSMKISSYNHHWFTTLSRKPPYEISSWRVVMWRGADFKPGNSTLQMITWAFPC
jgi:hypothetical protein